MIHKCEVWNGKEVLGYYHSNSPLDENEIQVFDKVKINTFRIIFRSIPINENEVKLIRCIDVRKKSKRQIRLVLSEPI